VRGREVVRTQNRGETKKCTGHPLWFGTPG
jgi:hypothetical protein